MPKLSAFLIAQDEEARIGPALASLKGLADEIVVVDGGSRDHTAELCEAAGARVVRRPFTDFADQKNFAMAQAAGDWLLSLDADEAVTPGLAREIRERVLPGAAVAYRVPRRSRIFGRWFRFSGTQNDAPLRIFPKNTAWFEQSVHEEVRTDLPVISLRETLEHRTYDSVSQYMRRFNRYTSMEAALRPGGAFRPKRLLARASAFFARQYFFQQGFRDGVPGFLFSVLSAYYVVIKRLKAWERERA